MNMYHKLSDVPLFHYGLIMADPPWYFENYSEKGEGKNATAHYDCEDLAGIKAMEIGHRAAPDCLLWLWATNPMLREAFEVMDAWGFKYVTGGHWSKKTVNGKQCFGNGYVLRSAGEPFLIGKTGAPWTSKSVRSVIEDVARDHSRKPDKAYAEAEKLAGPNVHRLDCFTRQQRPGWDYFDKNKPKWPTFKAAA